MTKAIKKIDEDLKMKVSALSNTSAKIRYLATMVPEGTTSKYGWIERTLKEFGVTTKEGNDIRFQHVRNVLITPVKGK